MPEDDGGAAIKKRLNADKVSSTTEAKALGLKEDVNEIDVNKKERSGSLAKSGGLL